MCRANWTREQTCYLRAMSPQTSGRSTHKRFRKYGESSEGQRSTSSPQKTTLIAKVIFQRTGMRQPTTGPTSSFMLFPPISLIPQVIREQKHRVLLVAPLWRNQHCFAKLVAAAHCSPRAYSPETRPPLSGEWNDLAPPARTTSLVSRWEASDLPESVLNTISQARAQSTRCLNALKWSVFSAWCTTHGADPVVCDVSLILSFLQELLEKGSPSTLKVHVAAIAASHAPIDGQSVDRNNLVVRFLKGV